MPLSRILFDLDGTLIDPKIGITRGAQTALAQHGVFETDLDDLEFFIGPPLKVTFGNHYGFSDEKTRSAIAAYRGYFSKRGVFENTLYPGVAKLLAALKERSKVLGLATTKPTKYAERILRRHRIFKRFDVVSGSALDDSVSDKVEIVRTALERMGDSRPEETVLVGDTVYDLEGAARNGIRFVGVTYGYGFRKGSLPEGHAFVHSIDELFDALLP